METLTERPAQAQSEATATPAAGTAAQTQQSPAIEAKLKLESKARNGANWFFWIAALSVINSIMTAAGTDWGFIIGLGVTQFIDAIGTEFGARAVTLVLSTFAAGTFALFGVLAHKRQSWAYMVGMILYALDGLLFLAVGDILSVGFHAFVLIWVFQGYQANKALVQTR